MDFTIRPPQYSFDEQDGEEIWRIVKDADAAFVPSLSARGSSVQQQLGEADRDPRGPVEYFHNLQQQYIVLTRDDMTGMVVGFMSFRYDHDLPFDAARNVYITTIIVNPACRRLGITEQMYAMLLTRVRSEQRIVATRTWSGNAGHIALLDKLGFTVEYNIPDDRGYGIDTLYFARLMR